MNERQELKIKSWKNAAMCLKETYPHITTCIYII